jgi:hypothetical protein
MPTESLDKRRFTGSRHLRIYLTNYSSLLSRISLEIHGKRKKTIANNKAWEGRKI